MPSIVAYHRPTSLAEAATLIGADDHLALGGGTVVVPRARRVGLAGVQLVDLQDLGLGALEPVDGGQLRIGAMSRVGDLVTGGGVPDLLRDLARRELPSTLRHQATVGGTVALAPVDSVLIAGLLVHGAVVDVHDEPQRPLAEVMVDGVVGRVVTAVTVETGGHGAIAATGRTPADDPIVAAVARRRPDGEVRLALTGVGSSPVLADPTDPTAGLEPPDDFRGSADYRRYLAGVLAARVIADLDGAAGR